MNILRAFFGELFLLETKKLIADCGHETVTKGTVTVNGKTISISCKGKPTYCLSCLEKLATSCALCGQPILPDAPVLRSTKGEIIGKCCTEMSLADCTGKWTEKGYECVSFIKLANVFRH